MDDQELARAQQWFERWVHKPCPVCNTDNWNIRQQLGQIENLPPGPPGMAPPAGRIPVLLIVCQTCGYFLPIQALVAGVRQLPSN
jgi:hypothetical protein